MTGEASSGGPPVPRAMKGKAWAAVAVALLAAGCIEATAEGVLAARQATGVAAGPARLGLGEFAMEPHVAVRDAGDRAVVVVANMADVREGPGRDPTTRIEVHRSTDGGATWTSALLPRAVLAAHDPLGELTFTGDAVLAYGPGGELYLAGVAAGGVTQTLPLLGPFGSIRDLSVFVTRSDDDGATWSPALYWTRGLGPAPLGVMQDLSLIHI